MKHEIDFIKPSEYQETADLWEASVKATHHFLKEEDIQYFKPLILNEYLKMVDLRCIRDNNKKILGFLGVAEECIEMLFIHPLSRGVGIGKQLLKFAIEELGSTKVDVNEDNPEACIFYEHHGFEVIGRSELDPTGRPYPILHMSLKGK
jgi:putative acetyltransferase